MAHRRTRRRRRAASRVASSSPARAIRSRASRGLGETPRRFAMRGTGLRRATRDARRPRDRPPRGKRHRGRYGHAPCWRAGTAFVAARVKEGESGASGRLLRIGEREGFCDLFGGYTLSYGAQFERRALGRHSFSQIYFSGFRHCVCRDEKNEKSMGRFAHTCRGVHAFTRARVFRASDTGIACVKTRAGVFLWFSKSRMFRNTFDKRGRSPTLLQIPRGV